MVVIDRVSDDPYMAKQVFMMCTALPMRKNWFQETG